MNAARKCWSCKRDMLSEDWKYCPICGHRCDVPLEECTCAACAMPSLLTAADYALDYLRPKPPPVGRPRIEAVREALEAAVAWGKVAIGLDPDFGRDR